MKHLLLTTIVAVVLVGCATTQQQEVKTKAKAADILIHEAVAEGNIEAVKQHLNAGTDVNAKASRGWPPLHSVATKEIAELLIAKGADMEAKEWDWTPLHNAADGGQKEIAELLITKDADVNAKMEDGDTPLDHSAKRHPEITDLLRKHGGKTGEELKAEGK